MTKVNAHDQLSGKTVFDSFAYTELILNKKLFVIMMHLNGPGDVYGEMLVSRKRALKVAASEEQRTY